MLVFFCFFSSKNFKQSHYFTNIFMAIGTFQSNTKIVIQLFWEEVNIVSTNQDTMAAILDLEFLQKVKTLFKDLLETISIKSCDLA